MRYNMLYMLTAIGLTTGGSITVNIYTQKVHRATQTTKPINRTTQSTKLIHRTTQSTRIFT